MIREIISAIISAAISISCYSSFPSDTGDNSMQSVGGIWQSPEEIPDDCGITVIDCKNHGKVRAELPSSFDISTNPDTAPFFPPIGNQGQLNSCAGWATTYYQFTYEVNRLKNTPADASNIMSPAWTYNYINGGRNTSTYITDAYSVLKNQGAMTLADYPYSGTASEYSYSWSTDVKKMTEALRYRASDIRIYNIDAEAYDFEYELSVIKSSISEGHAGVVWTNSQGWSVEKSSSGESVIVRGSSRNKYGHFMTVVGYDDDIQVTVNGVTLKGAFKIANSMGDKWGNNGYIWVSYDALKLSSEHGTSWQSEYSGTRSPVFSSTLKNSFYFINVKECSVPFVGYVEYISDNPWNLTLTTGWANHATNKKWSCNMSSGTSEPEFYCMVFDFFEAGKYINMSKYISCDWNIQLSGNSDNNTYQISTMILDNLGNPVSPAETSYGTLTGGIYKKTTSINLARGRVTSYDDKKITSDDSDMILNYIVNNVDFSVIQRFLADYNNDDIINVTDVILMNQTIAE